MQSSSYYASLIREEKEKLLKLQLNKKEVETMISTIDKSFYDDVAKINKNIEKIIEEGNRAIKQDSTVTYNINEIKNAEEHVTSNDRLVGVAETDLRSELRDVNMKITRCEERIRSLKASYVQAVAEEEAEKQREEEAQKEAEERSANKGRKLSYW